MGDRDAVDAVLGGGHIQPARGARGRGTKLLAACYGVADFYHVHLTSSAMGTRLIRGFLQAADFVCLDCATWHVALFTDNPTAAAERPTTAVLDWCRYHNRILHPRPLLRAAASSLAACCCTHKLCITNCLLHTVPAALRLHWRMRCSDSHSMAQGSTTLIRSTIVLHMGWCIYFCFFTTIKFSFSCNCLIIHVFTHSFACPFRGIDFNLAPIQ